MTLAVRRVQAAPSAEGSTAVRNGCRATCSPNRAIQAGGSLPASIARSNRSTVESRSAGSVAVRHWRYCSHKGQTENRWSPSTRSRIGIPWHPLRIMVNRHMATRMKICRGRAVSLTRIEETGDGKKDSFGLGAEGFFEPCDGSCRQDWNFGVLLL